MYFERQRFQFKLSELFYSFIFVDAVTSHISVNGDAHTLILIIKRNSTGSEFLGTVVTS